MRGKLFPDRDLPRNTLCHYPLSIEDKAEGSVCSNWLTTLLRNTPSLRAERYSVKPHTGQDPFTNLPPMP
ncbi:MAG: hypothetical protein MJZ77_03760 [Bacteroidales bacterium]|nr:hypothetical protein [Bacteroidales bacterium]